MLKAGTIYQYYKRILQVLSAVMVLAGVILVIYIGYMGVTSTSEHSLSYDWNIDDENNEDLYVKIKKLDTWVTEKGLATNCQGEIVNKTKYTITDWKVSVNVPTKCSSNNMWNGEWIFNSGVATFTPSGVTEKVVGLSSQKFGIIIYSKENMELNEVFLTYKRSVPVYKLPLVWILISIILLCAAAGCTFAVSYMQVRNYKKTHASYKDLVQESLRTIANIIDTKDEYTRGHSVRVAIYSRMLAKKMGLPEHEQERIYYIGLLHDIGKVGIPVAILTKPGRLDDEEYEIIKKHTRLGASIMKDFSSIEGAVDGIRYHHERYDGRGYNEGLKGEEIPLEGRIICVADSYDAMSSARCYRKSLGYDFILNELKENSGKQFDPEIVKYMIELVEEGYAPVSEEEMEYSQNEKKQ